MLAGRDQKDDEDEIIYIGINTHWQKQRVKLPVLPLGFQWRMAVNTGLPEGQEIVEEACKMKAAKFEITFEPRSVVILVACSMR
jgi:glycogen operon protein